MVDEDAVNELIALSEEFIICGTQVVLLGLRLRAWNADDRGREERCSCREK